MLCFEESLQAGKQQLSPSPFRRKRSYAKVTNEASEAAAGVPLLWTMNLKTVQKHKKG